MQDEVEQVRDIYLKPKDDPDWKNTAFKVLQGIKSATLTTKLSKLKILQYSIANNFFFEI